MDYNKYWSLDNLIGSKITEDEFQVLLTAGKIYMTRARMIGPQAYKAMANMGLELSDFDIEERTYAGHIVANSLKDAESIALKRGFGEEVEGVLHGVVSWDHDNKLFDLSNTN